MNKFFELRGKHQEAKTICINTFVYCFFSSSPSEEGHYCLLFTPNLMILTGTGDFKCESCKYLELRFSI